MAEWNDWSAENLRKVSESLKDSNEFDIITERSRGAIYRGGESEEEFTTVYYRTMFALIVFLVFLYILGSLGVSL
jgi:hypothetical protein